MIPTITVKKDMCLKCGMCVQDCPAELFIQESEGSIPEVHDSIFCFSCGHCLAICPSDAIIHSRFPQGYVQPVNRKNQPSPEGVLELLRTRRSIRVFQDKPVEKQQIERIIDAARFAPTARNTQTTGYIVVQNKKILAEIVQATTNQISAMLTLVPNSLMERLVFAQKDGKDNILHNAPALVIFHADERSPMPDINAQLAIQNATLMAHSLGLGSFYTGSLLVACQRDESIWHMINLPENHKIYGGLAIGYPKFEFKKWIERQTPEVSWI